MFFPFGEGRPQGPPLQDSRLRGNDNFFSLPFTPDPLPYFQDKPSCACGAPPSMKIGLLAGGDACQHSS
ncbi:hypothetical protein ISS30_05800 [bacterium]|nr:hypothetical protein [bacterium]